MLSPRDNHTWSQKRLLIEREKTVAKSSSARASAKKRWSKNVLGHNANALRTQYGNDANQNQNQLLCKKESALDVTAHAHAHDPPLSSDLEIAEHERLKKYPSFEPFEIFCREHMLKTGQNGEHDWLALYDKLSAPGWRMANGNPVVDWKARTRSAIREGWHLAKLPAPNNAFVTYEMVEEFCRKKAWGPPLPSYCWGQLRGDKFYGKPITNRRDFNAAMEACGSQWSKENK
jgi:hypothetical protein